MKKQLLEILPENRIRSRYIDLVSFACDAGFYYLLPKAVVQPINENEIIALFRFSHQHKIPLVFRAGGTSLSGQSITDGILVDLSQYWNKIVIEKDGKQVRVQPGITGAMVNAYLKKYQRKIGPDPSSINAAMMGGILSNNASGMCCGVQLNSYHTTKYIRLILPDGKIFTTEQSDNYGRFENECAELHKNLIDIRRQIFSNQLLYEKIRNKYLTKTTVGYSLNAFIDYEHPLDILAHLMIGAEGTLAFISEAVLDTVPDYPYKSTALLYFPTIEAACQAVVPLINAGAIMVELMDRASLHAIENIGGMPAVVKTLPEKAAALLIEFQDYNLEHLDEKVRQFLNSSSRLFMLNDPAFTKDAKEQEFLWKVRKGLFPAVGSVRASGTSVILEDLAFPLERLGNAISDLQELFHKYQYDNAIIFGHAKDGNIHFVITQSFNSEEEILRYDSFIKEVVTMVIQKYNGTLKAEHGTGRNMAPFVETEWGNEAYEILKRIKNAIDPAGLLNPGVILNEDKNAHIKHLKEMPQVEEEVDKCIECGYCEHVCPSRNITTTPRRRIVIRRVLKNLKLKNETYSYKLLLGQYKYDGMDTCAVDGLCAAACPVDINTGDLIKRLRRENHSAFANKMAFLVARNFKAIEGLMRMALKLGFGINRIFGKNAMVGITAGLKKIIPSFPLWSNQLTYPPELSIINNRDKFRSEGSDNTIIYFPSCITRIIGTYKGKKKNLMETFISICTRSGIRVLVPENIKKNCCSQIFSSKGFNEAQKYTAGKIVDHLWKDSREGALPIVIDVSSCAYTLQQLKALLVEENKKKWDQLKIMDSLEFLNTRIIPFTEIKIKKKNIILHPVCSLRKMNIEDAFLNVARHFSDTVTIPENAGCCGMAGDRGFLFPELTRSATMMESTEVQQRKYDGYYSTTKTCELALSEAVKENYESILYLADEVLDNNL